MNLSLSLPPQPPHNQILLQMLMNQMKVMRRRVNIQSSGMNLASQLSWELLRMPLTATVWQNFFDLRRMELFRNYTKWLYSLWLVLWVNLWPFVFQICSTKSDGKLTSLDQYISRMKPGQKDIFYITGTSKEQLEKSPFLERLTKKNYEVWHFFSGYVKQWSGFSFTYLL